MRRVQEGLFIEMAELSPNYLDSAEFNTGNQTKSHKHIPEVTDIMEWVQCFGIYVAIISSSKPKRVADLIGYQSIIIGASQIGREGKWVTYDRRFRLKASASPKKLWSNIDITIWNMTFPDRAIKGHLLQGGIPSDLFNTQQSQHSARQNQSLTKRQPICLDWNDSPSGCIRATCRYDHVCYRCVHNPRVLDKCHKASQCIASPRDCQRGNPH